jgi:hypothetical protein
MYIVTKKERRRRNEPWSETKIKIMQHNITQYEK